MALDPSTKRLLPWLVAVAFFMQTLDSTILNTALPRMASSLGESPLRMQSVVIAYMLTVALLIPASGWLAGRFGTRRVFMTAIVIFSLGSLLCALSNSLPMLVGARVVQGIGGALLPVGRLAVLRGFPRAELLKVLTFVTIPGLVGPLVGPTLGGWLVEVASWHWVFLINLPVGLVGVLASMRYMPELRGPQGMPFDWGGFVMFSLGLVLVSLALQGLGERALSLAASLLMLVGGLAAMVGYWLHAARTEQPLFSLAMFRIPTFAIGIAGNLFARLGSGAMPFLMPLFLQVGLGYGPTAAGLSLVPTAVGAMLCKLFAERLIKRFGYRDVLTGNTLLLGGMIASFGLVGHTTPQLVILLMLGLFGVGNALNFSAMNTLTLGDLDDAHAGGGNSLLSVVMQLSMSLGVAAGGALLVAFAGGSSGHVATRSVLQGFQATFVCVGVLSALASLIFVQLGQREAPTGPAALVDEG